VKIPYEFDREMKIPLELPAPARARLGRQIPLRFHITNDQ
jgi:hypothetical protein